MERYCGDVKGDDKTEHEGEDQEKDAGYDKGEWEDECEYCGDVKGDDKTDHEGEDQEKDAGYDKGECRVECSIGLSKALLNVFYVQLFSLKILYYCKCLS